MGLSLSDITRMTQRSDLGGVSMRGEVIRETIIETVVVEDEDDWYDSSWEESDC